MNVRDSEIVMGLFLGKGFQKAESADEADVVLFNSCSVRRHAEERAVSNMGALLKEKKQRPKVYGIIGCTAQALKKDLFRRLPNLDIVCGTGQIHRLPKLVQEAQKSKIFACGGVDEDIPQPQSCYREDKQGAFVSIMRGCNNFCSYCIVPYVRGKERSRKVEDILGEIRDLVKWGIREITLLGQNVNSYNGQRSKKRCDFMQLLKLINGIEGIKRINFITSHPKDATVELFMAIGRLDKVAKQLHLPLQSGSDRILKLMNRGYSARKYRGLARRLRTLVPGCRITTDMIVGFPGETEADFRKSYKIMHDIKFNAAYIFKYSPRPPAKSALMKDDVPRETKERRHKILLDLQKRLAKKISIVITLSLILSFSGGDLFAQSVALKNVEVLMLKGAYSQAARECERFLAGRHRAAIECKAYYLLGTCLLKEGRYDEARKNFDIILQRFPRSKFCDDASLSVANSYLLEGDYNQASLKYGQFLRDFTRSELSSIARRQQKLCKQGSPYVGFYFSVQLGCFSNKTNAEKLRDKLINNGYQAYILELPGDELYHVRVGKLSSRSQAESLEQRLKAAGYSTKICP